MCAVLKKEGEEMEQWYETADCVCVCYGERRERERKGEEREGCNRISVCTFWVRNKLYISKREEVRERRERGKEEREIKRFSGTNEKEGDKRR
jgi:hypothetical protein